MSFYWRINHPYPGPEPENGFRKPKWPMRFVSVMKETPMNSAENMTYLMPRAWNSCFHISPPFGRICFGGFQRSLFSICVPCFFSKDHCFTKDFQLTNPGDSYLNSLGLPGCLFIFSKPRCCMGLKYLPTFALN